MRVTAENIECLMLDAADGVLSASELLLLEAAVKAHPEWGIDWESDITLNHVSQETVVFEHKEDLKKYSIDEAALIVAIQEGRPSEVLSKRFKRNLKQDEKVILFKRPIFYYTAAAAVFAGLLMLPLLKDNGGNPAEVTAQQQPIAPAVNPVDTIAKPQEFTPFEVNWASIQLELPKWNNQQWYPTCGGVIYPDTYMMNMLLNQQNGLNNIAYIPGDSTQVAPENAPNLAQLNQDSTQWSNAIKLDSLQIAALEEKAMQSHEPRTLSEWVKEEANERITQLKGKHEIVLFKNRHRKNGRDHIFELEWKNLAIAF